MTKKPKNDEPVMLAVMRPKQKFSKIGGGFATPTDPFCFVYDVRAGVEREIEKLGYRISIGSSSKQLDQDGCFGYITIGYGVAAHAFLLRFHEDTGITCVHSLLNLIAFRAKAARKNLDSADHMVYTELKARLLKYKQHGCTVEVRTRKQATQDLVTGIMNSMTHSFSEPARQLVLNQFDHTHPTLNDLKEFMTKRDITETIDAVLAGMRTELVP